jgi:hypothetical protein
VTAVRWTGQGFEAVPSAASDPAMTASDPTRIDRHVVATMWDGARILGALRVSDPNPPDQLLDEAADRLVAQNEGVRPTVRVIEVAFGPPSPGHVQPFDAA